MRCNAMPFLHHADAFHDSLFTWSKKGLSKKGTRRRAGSCKQVSLLVLGLLQVATCPAHPQRVLCWRMVHGPAFSSSACVCHAGDCCA